MSRAIAISADYRYITPAETLIKSIAYHNKGMKTYLINSDIPQEWFINVNQRLAPVDNQVIDLKIPAATLANEAVSRSYMDPMIYGRILIPELVPEDRVLYIDADTIVNRNLNDLFNTDLGDNEIGAVKDFTMQDTFNSGVLLMDNQKIKQDPNFSHDLLERGKDPLSNDDQTLLNEYFGDHYYHLNPQYNVQIGLDMQIFYDEHHLMDSYSKLLRDAKPYTIIHYSTADKPWNHFSASRLRDKWWQYRNLEYSEIAHHGILPKPQRSVKGSFFTFTSTENLQHFEELVKTMPDYDFNVAAWTTMGDQLTTLSRYQNVHLFPSVIGAHIDSLISKSDAYLDINYGNKEYPFMQRMAKMNKPIIAFQDAAGDLTNLPHITFEDNDVDGMINKLKEITQ